MRAHQPSADPQTIAPLDDGTVALSMIQALIPLGLKAVEDALQHEVLALAGRRYAHGEGQPSLARWGSQAGSIFLADQKVPIRVPRVRGRRRSGASGVRPRQIECLAALYPR